MAISLTQCFGRALVIPVETALPEVCTLMLAVATWVDAVVMERPYVT
jgi:hypothetical protein